MFDALNWAINLGDHTYSHFHAAIVVALNTYRCQRNHEVIFEIKIIIKTKGHANVDGMSTFRGYKSRMSR